MTKRRNNEEWLLLVKIYKTSGLNLTVWCRKNEISKSSIYPYIKKFKEPAEPLQPKWGALTMPKGIETSAISLKIGSITLDIKKDFNKETLTDILNVRMRLC